MLSSDQLVYADNLFQLRMYKSDGQVYENLFVEVMGLRFPDFRAVKPQGSFGDRKNDGYSSQRGCYHQVYAPENSQDTASKAIAKLGADFAGLLAYWNELCPVQEYYFVVNDKFKGTHPTVEAELLRLKNEYRLRECRPFLNRDLMRVFSELDARQVMGVVGHLPSPELIPDLDYLEFTGVLSHIIENSPPLSSGVLLTVPDFSEKLLFNRISSPVAALLTAGNLQSGAVEGFFNSHSGFSKQAIRDKLSATYQELKASDDGTVSATDHPGDRLFFGLLNAIAPQPAKSHWQAAAIILMSYFFESCDIYDEPGLGFI